MSNTGASHAINLCKTERRFAIHAFRTSTSLTNNPHAENAEDTAQKIYAPFVQNKCRTSDKPNLIAVMKMSPGQSSEIISIIITRDAGTL